MDSIRTSSSSAMHKNDSVQQLSVCILQVRTAVTIAQLNGFIYAIGGERETQFSQYGTSYLNSVERYNIKTDSWDSVAPLKYSRSFAASAVLNGNLLSAWLWHSYSKAGELMNIAGRFSSQCPEVWLCA